MEDAQLLSGSARDALRQLEDAVLDASDREQRLTALDRQTRAETIEAVAGRVPAFRSRGQR